MKQAKPPPQPNYITKLHHLWRIGAIPRDAGLHLIDVSHDDWCGVFAGRRCDCDPDVKLKATVPGAMN